MHLNKLFVYYFSMLFIAIVTSDRKQLMYYDDLTIQFGITSDKMLDLINTSKVLRIAKSLLVEFGENLFQVFKKKVKEQNCDENLASYHNIEVHFEKNINANCSSFGLKEQTNVTFKGKGFYPKSCDYFSVAGQFNFSQHEGVCPGKMGMVSTAAKLPSNTTKPPEATRTRVPSKNITDHPWITILSVCLGVAILTVCALVWYVRVQRSRISQLESIPRQVIQALERQIRTHEDNNLAGDTTPVMPSDALRNLTELKSVFNEIFRDGADPGENEFFIRHDSAVSEV